MKKYKDIIWNEDGWTVIQDANAEKHVLELSCLTKDSSVIELRKRHNDGEEIVIKDRIDATHALPMSLEEFKLGIKKNAFALK